MTFKECKHLIEMDKERYVDTKKKSKIYTNPSFIVTFWFRIGTWLNGKHNVLAIIPKVLTGLIYKWLNVFTGIQMPLTTKVGGGLIFRHYSCIVTAMSVEMGENCTLHQGVTLGRKFTGPKAGVPTLADHVVVFPGAKIIGKVHIGSHAVIGANAVVINDVPDNCVAAGVPAKIVSHDSSKCFDDYGKELYDF